MLLSTNCFAHPTRRQIGTCGLFRSAAVGEWDPSEGNMPPISRIRQAGRKSNMSLFSGARLTTTGAASTMCTTVRRPAMLHHYVRAADVKPAPAFPRNAAGYRRFSLSDRSIGAVHSGWGLAELDAGGHVDQHVQSFEKSFYVLAGNPTLI